MKLNINIEIFKNTFGIKNDEVQSEYRTFSGHKPGTKLKLFPFDAHPGSSEVVKDLNNVVGGFIRQAQKEKMPSFTCDEFVQSIKSDVKFSTDKDASIFEDMLKTMFFDSLNQFKPTNIGTYKFIPCKTKEEKISAYLFDTLCNGFDISSVLSDAIHNNDYHVLEHLVMSFISARTVKDESADHYKTVITQMQQIFFEDFVYLLKDPDFAKEYLKDLLEHYYFFYTSQTCMTLNKFFSGNRNTCTPLYYSIDWEKTSKGRPCYSEGWEQLQKHLHTLFSHAVVLEILNQNDDSDKLDYIDLNAIVTENPNQDEVYASLIMDAANLYRTCIHDCDLAMNSIPLRDTDTKTEQAVRFLFDSVLTQFDNSGRSRANDAYTEKFELFCKSRFLKNRKTMGLMLNLTDRNLLFLTKLCLKNEERMKLNELFVLFEQRGIYLDTPSKLVVMDYFEKLNLIEKKSDSGDAQYVKGIL